MSSIVTKRELIIVTLVILLCNVALIAKSISIPPISAFSFGNSPSFDNTENIANFNSTKDDYTIKFFKNNKIDDSLDGENFSELFLSTKLDETLSVIEGNLSLNYYNNDQRNFNRIPFHLFPSGMQFDKQPGIINVLSVTTAGLGAINLPYEILSSQQLMWVNLTAPLEPNQNVSLHISFNTTLPDGLDRANSNGYDNNQSRIYTCSAFYPIPCVYDDYDGWNIDKYLDIGDPFYFDMAYYDLVIEVPKDIIVAATGELIDSTSDGVTTVHHYNPQYPVREVVFSASRFFQVESKKVNGVNISSFYLPHSNESWTVNALDSAINSLLLFNTSFGSYPYTTYNLVEAYGFYSGMEYPCQVQISESIKSKYPPDPEFYMDLTIAHETAHQWWSQLVGNDQVDWGHLDEGLTSWSNDFYIDYYYPERHYFEDYYLLDIVRTYYENNSVSSKVNQSAYDFVDTNMSYRFTAYEKAPLILQKLRMTLNNETFIAGLRYFFERYKFKIATFPNLQEAFEVVTGNSLDWFFLPWFDNPYLPKYNFRDVEYNANQGTMKITVEDLNEIQNNFPYSQQITLQVLDISQFGILYQEEVWINSTTILLFELEVKRNPGVIRLLYGSDILVQLTSAEDSSLAYTHDSWYSETPNVSWISLRNGNWIDWDFKVSYSDSKGIVDSIYETGTLRCSILQLSELNHTLDVVTSLFWYPTVDLLSPFTGYYTFSVDQEGHATPYYLLLVSPFAGRNFFFTQKWIESIQNYEDIDIQSFDIKNEGKSLTIILANENDNFTLEATYNTNGILTHLEIGFDPLYPIGSDGPMLSGYVILTLRNTSTELAELVELALIPFTICVIVAYTVWFLQSKRNLVEKV
jgi:hypothetical protein